VSPPEQGEGMCARADFTSFCGVMVVVVCVGVSKPAAVMLVAGWMSGADGGVGGRCLRLGRCKYTAAVSFAPPLCFARTVPLVHEVLAEAGESTMENEPEISLQVKGGGAKEGGEDTPGNEGNRKLDRKSVTSPRKMSSLNRSESTTSILTVPRLQYAEIMASYSLPSRSSREEGRGGKRRGQ
jgi:hypothetical protein